MLKALVSPDADTDSRYETYFQDVNLKHKLKNYLKVPSFAGVSPQLGNSIIDTVQQYSTIYQSSDLSYADHCRRQIEVLRLYYGNDLQLSLNDIESVCDVHIRGLAKMNNGKLFSLTTGLFGTMAMSATGSNDYSTWVRYEAEVTPYLSCVMKNGGNCGRLASSPPYDSDAYDGIITDPPNTTPVKDFLMPSAENYIGKKRHCDNRPGPNRLILDANSLAISKSDVLVGDTSKESCRSGALSQLFLSGYHPDQVSYSHFSPTGNGPDGNQQAVYVITEIGQEKQLDLMLDYLNLPEIFPLSSSAGLVISRLLFDPTSGDVNPKSTLISNPFKYTWITSPLNRFGRLDKTTDQQAVSYLPKPIGIHEDQNFMYFFFREADWESTPIPPYDVRRHHYALNNYAHSLYYPWEKAYIGHQNIKLQENGNTYEELYAPDYTGWKYMNANLRVTGRVARICKNDVGFPLGLQEPSLFELDYQLSLNTFQSFLKAKLSCFVPVAGMSKFIVSFLSNPGNSLVVYYKFFFHLTGVPFVWRLRKDENRMSDSGECITEVKKPENLYGKDFHYRAVSRDEYVTSRPSDADQPPLLKYYYLSHCKGYRWSYVPKPMSSSALYVEYPELRDFYIIDDIFYGVFSSQFSNEQAHSASTFKDYPFQPNLASAVCSFAMKDISSAFNGPFKKKESKSGTYRPFDPRKEGDVVSPSPYDCSYDQMDTTVKNMTVDFLDPTQQYSEETRHFDHRTSSSRLKFFEEDVVGSRTMWNNVQTTPILTETGLTFEKIVAQKVQGVTVLYAATATGLVYKIVAWKQDSKCRMTDPALFTKWLNQTKSMSSIWDNEFYAYLNRTVDKTTFVASFKSDLTMEKDVKFPDDVLVHSDWDCTPSSQSNIVAIFKPFGNTKTKIWDMKFSKDMIILATDEQVVQVPASQCHLYKHCATCSRDPHCGWNTEESVCQTFASGLIQSVRSPPAKQCKCQVKKHVIDAGDDIILSGLDEVSDLSNLQWYLNGTALENNPKQGVVFSHDTTLILMNVLTPKTGTYQLKDIQTGQCLALHRVSLSECQDEQCKFERKYKEWCAEYDHYLDSMNKWLDDYERLGFCSDVDV